MSRLSKLVIAVTIAASIFGVYTAYSANQGGMSTQMQFNTGPCVGGAVYGSAYWYRASPGLCLPKQAISTFFLSGTLTGAEIDECQASNFPILDAVPPYAKAVSLSISHFSTNASQPVATAGGNNVHLAIESGADCGGADVLSGMWLDYFGFYAATAGATSTLYNADHEIVEVWPTTAELSGGLRYQSYWLVGPSDADLAVSYYIYVIGYRD